MVGGIGMSAYIEESLIVNDARLELFDKVEFTMANESGTSRHHSLECREKRKSCGL